METGIFSAAIMAALYAEYVVDGVTEGNWLLYKTTYINNDAQAWWRVDLQGNYSIGNKKNSANSLKK